MCDLRSQWLREYAIMRSELYHSFGPLCCRNFLLMSLQARG